MKCSWYLHHCVLPDTYNLLLLRCPYKPPPSFQQVRKIALFCSCLRMQDNCLKKTGEMLIISVWQTHPNVCICLFNPQESLNMCPHIPDWCAYKRVFFFFFSEIYLLLHFTSAWVACEVCFWWEFTSLVRIECLFRLTHMVITLDIQEISIV